MIPIRKMIAYIVKEMPFTTIPAIGTATYISLSRVEIIDIIKPRMLTTAATIAITPAISETPPLTAETMHRVIRTTIAILPVISTVSPLLETCLPLNLTVSILILSISVDTFTHILLIAVKYWPVLPGYSAISRKVRTVTAFHP